MLLEQIFAKFLYFTKKGEYPRCHISIRRVLGAQKENPQQISTQFVTVESIEDYISKAKQLGARIVKDKQEISEGYYAVLEDPQKNTFGIWQEK